MTTLPHQAPAGFWECAWQRYRANLLHWGYEEHAPSSEAREADAITAGQTPCPHCGHRPCTYHPFTHPRYGSTPSNGPQRYVAVARCPRCGAFDEF